MRSFARTLRVLILVASAAAPCAAQSTIVTYQGVIENEGFPATGLVDLRFRLYETETGGTQVGPELAFVNVDLTGGFFTLPLDFGVDAYATASRRWLEVDARRAQSGSYETLSPRQLLAAAPFALNTRGIFVDATGNVGIKNTLPMYPLDVRGGFHASGGLVADASNLIGTDPRGTNPGWQSFVAEHSGVLRNITFRTLAPSAWSGTLQVFAGQGTGGAVLGAPIVITGPGSPVAQTVSVTIPGETPVVVGQQYTFAVTANGSFAPITSAANPYPPGQANGGANSDLYFTTQVAPTGLVVDENGRVGIGTLVPTSELDVRGNIRLGSSGQFSAPGAEENLRFIRGTVSGSTGSGPGYTALQPLGARFRVTYTTPFAAGVVPTVVLSPTSAVVYDITASTNTHFEVRFLTTSGLEALSGFGFIISGPR